MKSRMQAMVSNSAQTSRVLPMQLWTGKLKAPALVAMGLFASMGLTGCTALTQPINGIPSSRLPPEFFQEEKNNLVPIDVSLLAQEAPREYTLGPGDVLGITVDRILPYAEPDQVPELPPVNFPDRDSDLPPSTGFPITILDDGTISLPLLEPINVDGLTTDQVRDKIRAAYLDARILIEDEQRKVSPVVTIIRKRQINVVVIRQDQEALGMNQLLGVRAGQTGRLGTEYSASGEVIQLDAFKNDILNALMETGGLPGVSAKNEVKILRSSAADKQARLDFMRRYAEIVNCHTDPCSCPPPMPEDPTILRIPLRLPPGVLPSVRPEDVILEEGDIVLIETRDTEFFFTGGLLPGGQWPIPRDYDLDVLGAMALAGYGVNSGGRQGGAGGLTGVVNTQVVPPGRVYILRRTPCKGQIAIAVDITKAVNDPSARPIIQPGDTLILQYRPCEEVINFGTGVFFTFGLRELLSGN
ncbi:MAG: polysaccharide biosynthesis/export family protein [bacterium]|nr:polysaccharide biosynthesis/export family protein [bacterium]